MIIQPFNVLSRSVQYDFIDRDLLDSEKIKRRVNAMHAAALDSTQTAALCNNRGLADRGEIDNRVLTVFDAGNLLGIWMLGCITYVSGPWENLQTWNVINPGASVVINAVPMSGVLGMDQTAEPEFAADTAAKLLAVGLTSGRGRVVGFGKLHYGILLRHTDPISRRAQSHHAAVKVHPNLAVIEALHPTIPNMTLVEIRTR